MADNFWDGLRSSVNSTPIVGSIMEGWWGDPGKEAKRKENQRIIDEMQAARGQNYQTARNAMAASSQAFTPINNLVGQMYGQQAVPDMNALVYADLFPSDHPAFGGRYQPQPTAPPAPQRPIHPPQSGGYVNQDQYGSNAG
jgi:hypothetical protein